MPLAPAQKREQRERARARAATYFGANDEHEENSAVPTFPDGEKVDDLVSFAGLFYVDLPRDQARALASALVAAWPEEPVDYSGYDRQMPRLQARFEALMRQREIPRASGIVCYKPGCKTTPIVLLDTPHGAQAFCRHHAAVVRDNLSRSARAHAV
jgi:hypothetical protein